MLKVLSSSDSGILFYLSCIHLSPKYSNLRVEEVQRILTDLNPLFASEAAHLWIGIKCEFKGNMNTPLSYFKFFYEILPLSPYTVWWRNLILLTSKILLLSTFKKNKQIHKLLIRLLLWFLHSISLPLEYSLSQ